jgi:tetratricopeptide (TPR) repeat protein
MISNLNKKSFLLLLMSFSIVVGRHRGDDNQTIIVNPPDVNVSGPAINIPEPKIKQIPAVVIAPKTNTYVSPSLSSLTVHELHYGDQVGILTGPEKGSENGFIRIMTNTAEEFVWISAKHISANKTKIAEVAEDLQRKAELDELENRRQGEVNNFLSLTPSQLSQFENDFFTRDQYDSVLKYCERAFKIDPQGYDHYRMAARVFRAKGEYDLSLNYFSNAFTFAPTNDSIHFLLYWGIASTYLLKGDTGSCQVNMKKADSCGNQGEMINRSFKNAFKDFYFEYFNLLGKVGREEEGNSIKKMYYALYWTETSDIDSAVLKLEKNIKNIQSEINYYSRVSFVKFFSGTYKGTYDEFDNARSNKHSSEQKRSLCEKRIAFLRQSSFSTPPP